MEQGSGKMEITLWLFSLPTMFNGLAVFNERLKRALISPRSATLWPTVAIMATGLKVISTS